jgi:hypothetical protein
MTVKHKKSFIPVSFDWSYAMLVSRILGVTKASLDPRDVEVKIQN